MTFQLISSYILEYMNEVSTQTFILKNVRVSAFKNEYVLIN